MSRTRDKLKEAQFFLEELEQAWQKVLEFDYFLSAFVSSSRSILWIMRSEYTDVPGWEEWFDSKDTNAEESTFLKRVNELRVRSEKIEPLKTALQASLCIELDDAEVAAQLEDKLLQFRGKECKITIDPGRVSAAMREAQVKGDTLSFPGKVEDIRRTVNEFPDQDVVPVCRRYYSMLESLVDECHERFSR